MILFKGEPSQFLLDILGDIDPNTIDRIKFETISFSDSVKAIEDCDGNVFVRSVKGKDCKNLERWLDIMHWCGYFNDVVDEEGYCSEGEPRDVQEEA